MQSSFDFCRLDRIVRGRLTEKRYKHTLGVVRLAEWLALLIMPDRCEEIKCAAYLHDIAKELPIDESDALLSRLDTLGLPYGLTKEDRATAPALHSFLGALYIKEELAEYYTPDVFSSVFNHTLGSPDMSVFDRIIFVSDFAEENRSYESCIETRAFLLSSLKEDMSEEEKIKVLNKAVYLCCKYTVEDLKKKGLNVNSRTLLTKSAFARFF